MLFVVIAREHVGMQSTQGTLSRELARREHVDTQDTLTREYVSTKDTLAREHVSTQGTLGREHIRHAIKQTQGKVSL